MADECRLDTLSSDPSIAPNVRSLRIDVCLLSKSWESYKESVLDWEDDWDDAILSDPDPECICIERSDKTKLARNFIEQEQLESDAQVAVRLSRCLHRFSSLRSIRIEDLRCKSGYKHLVLKSDIISDTRLEERGLVQLRSLIQAVASVPDLNLHELVLRSHFARGWMDEGQIVPFAGKLLDLSPSYLFLGDIAFKQVRKLHFEWPAGGKARGTPNTNFQNFLRTMPQIRHLFLSCLNEESSTHFFNTTGDLSFGHLEYLALEEAYLHTAPFEDFCQNKAPALKSLKIDGLRLHGVLKSFLDTLRECHRLCAFELFGYTWTSTGARGKWPTYMIPGRQHCSSQLTEVQHLSRDIEAYVLRKSNAYPSKGLKQVLQ